MPRPKGEPTKVVRLPVAWLAPYEAEAKRTGRTLADVLTAREPTQEPRATEAVFRPQHLPKCACSLCKPTKAKA